MLDTLKEPILAAFSSYPYMILFIGLFFAGETVLLPAIYFALKGDLRLSYVIALALFATVLSDLVWYFVGSHMKNRFARKVISDRLERSLAKIDEAFTKRGAVVLFMSKFVYGTRTAVQVLAGLHQMRLRTYIAINFLGIFSLVLFIAALAYSIDATIESLTEIAHTLEVAFLVFVAVLVLTHVIFGVIWKKWFQR
jgi:membrane protein DedA with SNARE-associated domain